MPVLHDFVATLHTASGNAALLLGATATLAVLIYRRYRASQLTIPFLKFEDGDDSRQRYVTDSGSLFKIGYEKVPASLCAERPGCLVR